MMCRHGHVRVAGLPCKECARVYDRTPTRLIRKQAKKRRTYLLDPSKERARVKVWYEKNRARKIAYVLAWKRAHRGPSWWTIEAKESI